MIEVPEAPLIWTPHPGPQTRVLSISIDEILYGGARGGGKGQALDAPVLTPWGFRPMGSLRIGSAVSNPDGSASRVIGIYPLGVRQLYRVEFVDGTSCEVTDDHIWFAWQSNKSRKHKNLRQTGEASARLWTTAEMIPLIGRKERFMIPASQAVAFNDTARGSRRPVPAYSLGALLGDGSLGDAIVLSCDDEEIAKRFIAEVGKVTKSHTPGKCPGYRVSLDTPMARYLKKAGLLGHDCYSKFIPKAYLLGSEAERWALLQGLMDTDGWADKDGDIYFATTSRQLRDDMAFLARSLGGIVTTTEKHPTFTGTNGEKKRGSIAWTLRIKLRDPKKAFHLERKKRLARAPHSMGKAVKKITPSRMAEAQCIQVSNPNGLYVTNDFIVTHNTDAGIIWIAIPACGPLMNPRFRGLVLRKNHVDLKDWLDRARMFFAPFGAVFTDNEFRFPCGAVIRTGHLADPDSYQRYQGHEYQRILIEELTHIPTELLFQKVLASCRSTVPGLRPSFLGTTNPGGPGHGWVKRRYIDPSAPGKAFRSRTKAGDRWRIYIPAKLSDNPTLAGDSAYRAVLEELPDHLRRAWLDGDWDALAGQYFSEFNRSIHVVKPFKIPAHWERYCGLDWGYWPDPWACVWVAFDENGDAVVYRQQSGNRMTPAEVAQLIKDKGREPREVVADPSMWAKKDGDSSADKMEIAGLILTKGVNDRLQGWMRLHEYLKINPETGLPRIRFFESCTDLIAHIPALIHDEKNPEDAYKDHAIDHDCDALRYLLMSRPICAEQPRDDRLARLDERTRRAYEHRKQIMSQRQEYDDL